jgi:hypothetical protein
MINWPTSVEDALQSRFGAVGHLAEEPPGDGGASDHQNRRRGVRNQGKTTPAPTRHWPSGRGGSRLAV